MLISELNLIEFVQKRYHKLPKLPLTYLYKTEVGKNNKKSRIESVFLIILPSTLSK